MSTGGKSLSSSELSQAVKAGRVRLLGVFDHGIVLGLWPAAYKHVARSFVQLSAAPLGLRHPDTLKCAVVLELIKDEALRVGATRPSLMTASARAGLYSIAGRAEETGCTRSNKKL